MKENNSVSFDLDLKKVTLDKDNYESNEISDTNNESNVLTTLKANDENNNNNIRIKKVTFKSDISEVYPIHSYRSTNNPRLNPTLTRKYRRLLRDIEREEKMKPTNEGKEANCTPCNCLIL